MVNLTIKLNVMKRYFLVIVLIPVLFTLVSSCEDNRDQNMVPDKVYLAKTGMHTEESFDIGENVVTQLWANKSGLNGASCNVTFAVNADVLDEYNLENGTNFELLPANLYSMPQSTFVISGDEQYAKLMIEYDPAAVHAESGVGYGVAKYVLPITIHSDDIEVTDANTALLCFVVNEPLIRILSKNFEMLRVFEGDEEDEIIERKVEIGMAFTNRWNANITIETDRDVLKTLAQEATGQIKYVEKRLKDKNLPDTEDFEGTLTHIEAVLPPEDAYTISEDLSVKPGVNSLTVTFTIDKSKLHPGVNVIPVKLTGVTEPLVVDASNSVCYIPVQYVPDRSEVPIKSSSSHQNADYSPKRIAGLFDGDFDISWRPGVGAASFPSGIGNDNNPAIVVDLGTTTDVSAVEIWTRGPGERQGSRNETYRASPSYITNLKVYVSSDDQCWESANGEFLLQGTTLITGAKSYWGDALIDYNWQENNPNSAPLTLNLPGSTKGRYVIIWYSKSANQADLWELFIFGNR